MKASEIIKTQCCATLLEVPKNKLVERVEWLENSCDIFSSFFKVVNQCKAGFHLEINQHKNYYENVENYLVDLGEIPGETIPMDIWESIRDKDNLVEIQFYPDTPIGFHKIYHHDILQALVCLKDYLKDED
jgi:hypothetical protein